MRRWHPVILGGSSDFARPSCCRSTWPGDRRQLDLGGLGSRPLDALNHPINTANLEQMLDEFENGLVAAGGFAASSP